ncbi:hypothetical protein BJ741DRAFT_605599 [Chytriomyces cf. hyalinus JEL632]|nr:hypothetical protein BJ741DRAFT_605599 [Chytriomyces cf. hyalinus JEL632]
MSFHVGLSAQHGRRHVPSITSVLTDPFGRSKSPIAHNSKLNALPATNVKHAINLDPAQEAHQAAVNRVAKNAIPICSIASFRHTLEFIHGQVVKVWQYLATFASSQLSIPASQQRPCQPLEHSRIPSEQREIYFAFHRHSLPAKNHVRCVNFLKHVSMQSAISHLQSELNEERKGRIYISAVHAKIQGIAAQQKETIEKLEGVVESLQNDVKAATARLLAVQSTNSSKSSSVTMINMVQHYGSDFDCKDDLPPVPKTRRTFKKTAGHSDSDTTDMDSSDEDSDNDSD